ncbi:MAG: lasso peptide biosynthesis B2 protein, partial [Candidatus Eremiobacterota bacterium]
GRQSGVVEKIQVAVQRAGWISPWRNRCLVSSLAARWMLRRRKIGSELSLGVAKDTKGNLVAHAWLKSGDFEIFFGEVEVKEYYTGYKIKKYDSMARIVPLDLPPLLFKTMSLWFIIPEKIKGNICDLEGALHGAEHAMIGVMPFHVMCDRWDIGGLSTPWHADTGEATIFIYDGFEGGIGLSEKAFHLSHEIVKMTFELVRDCPCEEGCPACIYSPKCGNENETLHKKASEILLKFLYEGFSESG